MHFIELPRYSHCFNYMIKIKQYKRKREIYQSSYLYSLLVEYIPLCLMVGMWIGIFKYKIPINIRIGETEEVDYIMKWIFKKSVL